MSRADLRVAPNLAGTDPSSDLAVMLTGGGARAAYQVGLLKGIARHFPHIRFDIVTGVSAGAINAAVLAARVGSLSEKADDLARMWLELECHSIFEFDWRSLLPFIRRFKHPGGIVDTQPLSRLMQDVLRCKPEEPIRGIIENLENGEIHAVSLITLDYSTGQSVRWSQGRHFSAFEGPNHRSVPTELTLEHVLASSALPFLFPAVKIGDEWHGDGGIRLAAPLSPAVHLGARRIIAMSTGYQRTADEASRPAVPGYPPAAQILGQLVNSVFLDAIDEDVHRMERMNALVRQLDHSKRDGLRPIDLLVLRPSIDLGKLAAEYEKYLPRNVRLLTRALGARETESPDFVSMLLFEPHYTRRLIEIGEADVEARLGEIGAFLNVLAVRTVVE